MIPDDLPESARILIVDSEANRAAAAVVFPTYHVVYPGRELHLLGRKERRQLAGRHVTIWPTAGERAQAQAEACAAVVHGHASAIRIVRPNGSPEGLCVASEYWQRNDESRTELLQWVKQHAADYEPPPQLTPDPPAAPEPPPPAKRGRPRSKPDGSPPRGTQVNSDGSAFIDWQTLGLSCTPNGMPHCNVSNAALILAGHPRILGNLWYDEFHQKVFSTLFSETREPWAEFHDTRLTIWMQQVMRLPKMTTNTVREAVVQYAMMNPRNEPRDWLNSLVWDGTERLAHLFSDGFGATFDEYTAAVGRCFVVGMVARIFIPGCKLDNAPVLEGSQGVGKSSGLAILGGPFFAESHESITSKDFFQSLQGKMLLEMSEMHAFSRADILRIKGVISCPTDRFRESYGRYTKDHPRNCVFAGTTNLDDWNEDETGARRFWPIRCGHVNRPWLSANRDQLFAEAVALFKRVSISASDEIRVAAGADWWQVPERQAKVEQEKRRAVDEWEKPIAAYCAGRNEVTISEILEHVLAFKLSEIGKKEQLRVAKCLKLDNYERCLLRIMGHPTRLWKKRVVTDGDSGNENAF